MFIYHTNDANLITDVNQAFTQFALENWRPDFSPQLVLGTNLFRHISDPTTRHMYSLLMERARATGRPITLQYRCDSPEMRRFMEMTILPGPEGGMEWNSRILRLEPREPVSLLEEPPECHEERLLSICSWCKRAQVPEWLADPRAAGRVGQWLELEDLMGIWRNSPACKFPFLTHTACPDCYQQVLRQIDEYGSEGR